MRYTILLHYPEMMAAGELDQVAIEQGQAAFQRYAADLDAVGALVSAEVLQPTSDTTTVQSVGGELRIQDGPFADTKEKLGGIVVIEVDDLDAALGWARQAPSIEWGPIEVRPTATRYENGAWTS